MRTPVDRGDQPLSSYLLKILTLLVKQAGGEIRVEATDMLEESTGDGITKFYDRSKKQLVLTYIQSGSEVLFTKAGDEWQSNLPSQLSPASRRSSIVKPLDQSDLMEDSMLSRESQQINQPISRNGSTLDDQRISDLEDHLRKEAAARTLANFPSTPVTAARNQPLREVSSRQPRKVQPSFYRG